MKILENASFFLAAGLLSFAVLPASALTTNLISIADTGLHEHDPNNNLGGMLTIRAGTISQGFKSRALFKFDIGGALPTGATITAATLSLNVPTARGAGLDFELHRMLTDWGEGNSAGGESGNGLGAPAAAGEATWNARFHPATLWAAPGGLAGTDFSAIASATNAMESDSLQFSSDEMAADVQMWLNFPGTNFGWMVMIADEAPAQTASHLSTRDTANPPLLTIEFTQTITSPPANPPTIFGTERNGDEIRFSFNAESNRAYTVEIRDSQTASNWTVLTNILAQPAEMVVHITNAISSAERYFRIRTP